MSLCPDKDYTEYSLGICLEIIFCPIFNLIIFYINFEEDLLLFSRSLNMFFAKTDLCSTCLPTWTSPCIFDVNGYIAMAFRRLFKKRKRSKFFTLINDPYSGGCKMQEYLHLNVKPSVIYISAGPRSVIGRAPDS